MAVRETARENYALEQLERHGATGPREIRSSRRPARQACPLDTAASRKDADANFDSALATTPPERVFGLGATLHRRCHIHRDELTPRRADDRFHHRGDRSTHKRLGDIGAATAAGAGRSQRYGRIRRRTQLRTPATREEGASGPRGSSLLVSRTISHVGGSECRATGLLLRDDGQSER